MKACENCTHYKRDPASDNWLKEDESGECDAIAGVIDIELVTGMNGGYVERIDVPYNFSCAAFHKLSKPK